MKKEDDGLYYILESSVMFDNRLIDKEKILYSIICFYSNNSKGYCFKRNSELITMLNVTKAYFYKMIKTLDTLGYIKVIKTKTRSYLMPTINKIYLEAQRKRKEREEYRRNHPLTDYNWLNDEEEI